MDIKVGSKVSYHGYLGTVVCINSIPQRCPCEEYRGQQGALVNWYYMDNENVIQKFRSNDEEPDLQWIPLDKLS